ncbi:hypothetical protein GcC1_203041 [Golovinomyces cichoracearum]|uniref:Uncharacterized protein n=1 Tax=Golovinomyces cichoracearum TaxID=62708 RepID=A0A420HDA5_9PEZI|nr:hypothetical protein GcC1_203041 [Golovinomyces cichoracearum]
MDCTAGMLKGHSRLIDMSYDITSWKNNWDHLAYYFIDGSSDTLPSLISAKLYVKHMKNDKIGSRINLDIAAPILKIKEVRSVNGKTLPIIHYSRSNVDNKLQGATSATENQLTHWAAVCLGIFWSGVVNSDNISGQATASGLGRGYDASLAEVHGSQLLLPVVYYDGEYFGLATASNGCKHFNSNVSLAEANSGRLNYNTTWADIQEATSEEQIVVGADMEREKKEKNKDAEPQHCAHCLTT